MKIVAAIMDVALLKFCRRQWIIKRSVKKFLVYDPREVTSRHVEKKEDE